jgi:hypothetical protein
MSIRVYRVQDSRGRGPFAPGLSHRWADEEFAPGMLPLPTWGEEFGIDLIDREGRVGETFGCATRTLDGLLRWFSASEAWRLDRMGFSVVLILPGRIIAESPNQLVFARYAPLTRGVIVLPWASLRQRAA